MPDQNKSDEFNTRIAIDMMRESDKPIKPPHVFELESLPSFLNARMGQAGLSTQELFEQARLDRSTGFKIMNGQRLPSRDVLLRVAFVLHLSVDETQALLKIGRRAQLTPRDARDAVLLFGLVKGMTLYDLNDALSEAGEEEL